MFDPDTMSDNPFTVFGLPLSFDVDLSALRRQHVALIANHHPDRFTDPLDQADAAERCAAINEAWRELESPLSRAEALLRLLGAQGRTDDKSLPPHLLMEMMEIREELEEAIDQKDAPTLDRLRQWASDQQTQILADLRQSLTQAIAADKAARPPHLQAARTHLNTLRYIERLRLSIPPGSFPRKFPPEVSS